MKKILIALIFCLGLVLVNSPLLTFGGNPSVTSYAQWRDAMDNSMNNLEPGVKLSIKNFDKDVYKLDNLEFPSVNIHAEGTIIASSAVINYSFDYPQNFKLLAVSENEALFPRLTLHERRIYDKAKALTEALTASVSSDYDKILNIHDYIISNTKYDSERLDNGTIPENSFTIGGILDTGVGVCEAYAATFQLMCRLAGVESIIVTGSSKGVAHAWNMVKLEGEYYHIDTTWNDPLLNDIDTIIYKYFNLTDKEISKDHVWDKTKTPPANGVKYNYYVYHGSIFGSMSELQTYLKAKLSGKPSEVHFHTKGFSLDAASQLDFTFGINGIKSYSVIGELGSDGAYLYIPKYN